MTRKTSKKNINASVFFKRLLLVVLAVYICVELISQQVTLSNLNKDEKTLDSGISQQEKLSKELNDELKRSGTDEYMEYAAREKLGYTKKNEKVFIDINK